MNPAPPAGAQPVLLFSGHRVDAPGRPQPRFPPQMVPRAAAAIDAAVLAAVRDCARASEQASEQAARHDAASGVGAAGARSGPSAPPMLALTQGAAGGDLLFAESALRQGLQLQLLQPLPEPEFIRESVQPSADGDGWVARYRRVVERLPAPPLTLPAAADPDLDADPDGNSSPYVRCNHWLLQTALQRSGGQAPLQLICLWNGAFDDGPGGTGQMVAAVRQRGGRVHWIDTRQL